MPHEVSYAAGGPLWASTSVAWQHRCHHVGWDSFCHAPGLRMKKKKTKYLACSSA